MTIEMRELAPFDAIGLADEIRRGRLFASEVLEATISAIDHLNPRLNAVVYKLYDQARDQIRRLDPHLPFAGVPFLAKDLFAEIVGTPLLVNANDSEKLSDDGGDDDATRRVQHPSRKVGPE